MDFDDAKENIQPLASGRNAERLETALSAESHQEVHEQILEQRREFERAIDSYSGDDPLEIWYEYIEWIEQSYPKSGKETALNEVISSCLSKFENEERYKQDRRMIKLFIKYIDSEPNPHEYYELLYNNGIGTIVADLYLCWAHYYDYNDNFEKADNVYQKGLDARAQPLDQLQQAYKHFGFSMSQRLLHKDASTREKFLSSMDEQRLALTSLRAHKHRHVGSIRTGTAVKNYNPGRVEQQPHTSQRQSSANRTVNVFEDENQNANVVMAAVQTPIRGAAGTGPRPSIVQTILSSAKKHENLREPGPWNNAKLKTARSIVGTSANQKLAFDIMKDEDLIPLPDEQNMFKRGIQLPSGFVKKNLVQTEFESIPLHRDEDKNSRAMAGYDKFMLFPSADKCYSLEELWAYKWWKKRNVSNDFTRAQDAIWGCGYGIPIRLPPHFRRHNDKQVDQMELEPLDPKEVIADGSRRFDFNIDHIYTADDEYSMEELLQSRWLNGELLSQRENEMELTLAFNRRESVFVSNANRRSTVLGGRRSILPANSDAPRKSIMRKSMAPPPSNNHSSEDAQPPTIQPCANVFDDHIGDTNKRKSFPTADGVDQEMKSPPPFRRKLEKDEEHGATQIPKFEIFQDGKEAAAKVLSTNTKDVKDVFKTPKLPAMMRPRASSVFELGDDNEGCTTQTFNFFIKSQSVSTPKANEKPAQHRPACDTEKRCNLFAENENAMPNSADLTSAAVARQPFASRMPSDETLSPQFLSPEMETNHHKLSAILETTEDANTISSAATISSKSSSVEELRTMYEANLNVDSIVTAIVTANKSAPLTTIDEIDDVKNSCSIAAEAILPNKNVSFPSVLPFEIYDENSAHHGGYVSKVMQDEPPSMCTMNLFEEKTETIPQMLINRNHTIEASFVPNAEPTIPLPFAIPPINESIEKIPNQSFKQQTAAKPSGQSNFSIFEDDATSAVDEPETKTDQTANKSVFNFGTDRSLFAAQKTNAAMNNFELSDPMLKFDLSSGPTMPIQQIYEAMASAQSNVERSKFNIFQNESNKTIPAAIDDIAEDMSVFTDRSLVELKDDLLQMSTNSTTKDAIPSSGSKMEEKTCNSAVAASKPKVATDIDDEYYKLIQSPEISRSSKSVSAAPSKLSMANNTDMGASVANERSASLLKPMKECSLTEYKQIGTIAATFQPQEEIPYAQFTFSEDNPNTELFALNLASIKNSTLLEGPLSPLPPTENVLKLCAETSSNATAKQEKPIDTPAPKEDMSIDDQFYALMNSPLPPMPPPISSKVLRRTQANQLLEISGMEFNEAEMNLMRESGEENATDITFPNILISQPQTIRASVFDRMPANYTIADSVEESIHRVEQENDKTSDHAKHVIDDRSVFIVEPTEDLGALTKQSVQQQSSVNVSGTSFIKGNHLGACSPYRKGSVSIDYSESQHIDPFDLDVRDAFLAEIDFVDYISKLDSVYMVNRARAIQPDTEIAFGDKEFQIIKQIGIGSFGFVYSGKCLSTQKMYAFKQERPANLWEFYISLELRSRIEDKNILAGFLVIDFALIGSNSSVFASQYCPYGSLIDICNKHKEKTFRNSDELIVMMLANQMLMIVDHMHGSNIIHGDIKPDNFLMMKKLKFGDSERITLKLIDYGQSIDLNFYDRRQTFRTKLETKHFICTEMLEGKPWTFQIDLFCVASTIYSMLCGKYMNVAKMPPNSFHAYTLSEPLPIHLDNQLWMNVMHTLINVRDCDSMPNLQSLRLTIKEAIHVRERFLDEKIRKFNSVIDQSVAE